LDAEVAGEHEEPSDDEAGDQARDQAHAAVNAAGPTVREAPSALLPVCTAA